MKYIKLNRRGFSLVELIVVIAIMAVLAGVVGGSLIGRLHKSQDDIALVEIEDIIVALRIVYLDAVKDKNISVNLDYLRDEFLERYDMPDPIEAGKSGEHKYLLELVVENGTNKYIKLSYIPRSTTSLNAIYYVIQSDSITKTI